MTAEAEKSGKPLLERDKSERLETLALGLREVVVRELAVRATPPEREPLLDERERECGVSRASCVARFVDQPLETLGIERLGASSIA